MALTASDLQNIDIKIANRNTVDLTNPYLDNIKQNAENGVLEGRTQYASLVGWLRAIGERMDLNDGKPAGTMAARAAQL